ncbi:hypothetical protein H9P43_006835 [Blastocladiella emersonii ATCC 22665]|nr:hypothetical protein H9P43_006835 [Blastocladiella emersonii ATCC 22665]
MKLQLLVLLIAALLAAASVHAAPTATKRGRRRLPLELPKQRNMATLPYSFGQENITTIDLGKIDPKRGNVQCSRLVIDAERTNLRKDLFAHHGAGEEQTGDVLKITNLVDGSVQWLNAFALKHWNYRSAFFNGGKLKVELLISAKLPVPDRVSVVVTSVIVNHERGNVGDPIPLPLPASLCNAVDSRKASTNPRDWAYFGTRANPNTGLSFKAAAGGRAFSLAALDAATDTIKGVDAGAAVTLTGYGIVRDANSKQFEQVQQSSTGKLVAFEGAEHVHHRFDCDSGSSGSPLVVGDVAIGIHTNGGCDARDGGSANYGSTVAMRGLREALANPKGVCKG